MRKPASMKDLEELGRVRLSLNFFMRDMLYSEISNFHGIPNIPDDPELAIAAGTRLCEELLEPLHATFGQVSIRSAFRCVAVNDYGYERRAKLVFDSLSEGTGSQLQSNQSFTSSSIQYSSKV